MFSPHRFSVVSTRRKVIRVVWCIALLVIGHSIYTNDFLTRRLQILPEPKPQITNENPNQPLLYPPPQYERLYEWEKNLPQHDLNLPYPEGRTGRYVNFANQIRLLGWNNVFNELLMNALLAYESDRAYVFQDYFWKPEYYPWQPVSPPWPHIPLNSLISGPVAGGMWDPEDPAPRSITEDWYNIVCPKSERLILNTKDIKPAVQWEPGDVVFNHWKRILRDAPERCVEVVAAPLSTDSYPQTFDLWLWGTTRILPLWEKFSTSPVSRLLEASPLVNSAIARNEHLFNPRGPRPKHLVTRSPYDRMMAVHVRRGDYKNACMDLAKWNATYYSWNLLESLPDHFDPPAGGEMGNNTPENIEKYLEHCWPTSEALLQKIHDAREEYIEKSPHGTRVDIMFILTNDVGDWVDALKRELLKDGYHTIVTSRDLVLDQEQVGVNMAIDMDISRRAAVFIGNGWSSFTSNIVHRRLVDGKKPVSIRFW